MFTQPQKLIVVYKEKDELAVNQLKKLIVTNDDDVENGIIIGTEDKTVKIVTMEEKVWLSNKAAGTNVDNKILFIGDEIKGVDKLIPTVDEKYNKFGVTYGWSGDQAVIWIDEKALGKKTVYQQFITYLQSKTDLKIAKEEKKIGIKNKQTNLKIGGVVLASFLPVANTLIAPISLILSGSLLKDVFGDAKLVRNQQLILGVSELYANHLEQFIKE